MRKYFLLHLYAIGTLSGMLSYPEAFSMQQNTLLIKEPSESGHITLYVKFLLGLGQVVPNASISSPSQIAAQKEAGVLSSLANALRCRGRLDEAIQSTN